MGFKQISGSFVVVKEDGTQARFDFDGVAKGVKMYSDVPGYIAARVKSCLGEIIDGEGGLLREIASLKQSLKAQQAKSAAAKSKSVKPAKPGRPSTSKIDE